jgi:hypothetical protein
LVVLEGREMYASVHDVMTFAVLSPLQKRLIGKVTCIGVWSLKKKQPFDFDMHKFFWPRGKTHSCNEARSISDSSHIL